MWYRLWAPCGENLVRVHDRVRNQLRGFDGSGTEMSPIDLPPVPFTEVSRRQFGEAVFGLRQAEMTGDVRTRLNAEDSVRVRCGCGLRLTGPFRKSDSLTDSTLFASRVLGSGVYIETKTISRPSRPSHSLVDKSRLATSPLADLLNRQQELEMAANSLTPSGSGSLPDWG